MEAIADGTRPRRALMSSKLCSGLLSVGLIGAAKALL
jgi:hypothetical protein